MTFQLKKISAATVISTAVLLSANAQDDTTDVWSKSENADIFEFSYGTPDSPALALSGLSASDVTQANQLKTFVATLPKFDSGETALALDYTPLGTVLGPAGPDSITIEDYRRWNWFQRTAVKTKISWVGQNGVDDTDPSKATKSLMSVGASWSMLESSDPLLLDGNEIEACRIFRDAFVLSFEDQRQKGRFLEPVEPIYSEIRTIYGTLKSLNTQNASLIKEALDSNVRLLLNNADRLVAYNIQAQIAEGNQIKFDQDKLKTILASAEKEIGNSDALLGLLSQAAVEADRVSGALNNSPDRKYVRETAVVTKGDVSLATNCQAEIDKKLKRAANWDIGAAHIWRGETDEFGDFEGGAYAFWTSVRVPLFNSDGDKDSYWVLGGTARLGFDETVSTGNEMMPDGEADTTSVWGGLEYFSEKWRAGARYGWVKTDYSDQALEMFSSDGERWLLNADYNVAPNIWLTATYGEADGTVEALQGEQLSVGLKFSTPTALNFFAD